MNKIAETISKGIKEGKWIDVTYCNRDGETTYFWIAIVDIDLRKHRLYCDSYNETKSFSSKRICLSFEGIRKADVLFFTSYEVPSKLIDKLEHVSSKELDWLEYDKFNCNILLYYKECSFLDNDPYQKEYCMIEGVDLDVLRKNKFFVLEKEQEKKLLEKVYHNEYSSFAYRELVINVFSIDKGHHKYVVCYYPLTYNPKEKTLVVGKELLFNKSFLIEDTKNSLSRYVEGDLDSFINRFKDKENYYECRDEIVSNFKFDEKVNTRPDIMLLERKMKSNLDETYQEIQDEYEEKELPKPLTAFFGNLVRKRGSKKEPSLVVLDKKINIDQMRVLYNSLSQPVTYVQGPPGTGKTQTILNAIISSFINDRSILVSSSNNIPVNGIASKLNISCFSKELPLPFLRLGNYEETIKATKKILALASFDDDFEIDEGKMLNVITNNKMENALLREKLFEHERKLDLEDLIISGKKLINSFEDDDSYTIRKIKEKVKENEEIYRSIPSFEDEMIPSLIKPIEENEELFDYLYAKSLKCIRKLRTGKYKPLLEICSIEDEEERTHSFNSYLKDDDNLSLLMNAFPIILSTNISSAKLGTGKEKFDLVIIDEAGQCNVAEALLPLARARNLLLVGDNNQLKPVILLEDGLDEKLLDKYNVDKGYSYRDNSILSVMQNHDSVSKRILLSYHYRCGKKIINYSNRRYYNSELKTSKIKFDGQLRFLDIKNVTKSKNRNQNIDECLGIIDYIKRNNVTDATIITPFVNQQELMNELLKKENIKDVNCGTIHSLQGAEKDTIIFSTSISPRTSKMTYSWLKNNAELINVGVTRAKKNLVVVSDYDSLSLLSDHNDDLYALVNYVRGDGEEEILPSENRSLSIGKSNNSQAENEFFTTISQFCSVNKKFEAKRNVSFKSLFKDDPILSSSNMEFDLVLYSKNFLSKRVEIVIEINGGEHFGSKEREKSDQIKRDICKERGWKFLSIPNSFVKSYEEIREIILSSKGGKYEQMTLFE